MMDLKTTDNRVGFCIFIRETEREEKVLHSGVIIVGGKWGRGTNESDCDGSSFHFNERRNAQLHEDSTMWLYGVRTL